MAITKLRVNQLDGFTELKILVNHPMENGRNRDHNGQLIPAHFIRSLQVFCNQTLVATVDLTGSVSKNPFLVMQMTKVQAGDQIRVSWEDNLGQSDNAELTIT